MDDDSHLTKHLYKTGLSCPRKMWEEAYRPVPPDPRDLWKMEEGKEVHQAARDQFPHGRFITGEFRRSTLQKTKRALRWEDRPLFEPAFLHEGMAVRVDILQPLLMGEWILTEVKSSTSIDNDVKRDVAFQKYVLEASGLTLDGVKVMHLNSTYRYPDDGKLFKTTDLTGELDEYLQEVEEEAPRLVEMLGQLNPPKKDRIRACKNCGYQDRCWDLPEQSLFTLPEVPWQHVDRLLEQDLFHLDQLEGHELLKPHHEQYIEAVREEEPYIEEEEIGEALEELDYPLHFLDFESIGKALPWLEGTKPWQQVPFQFSLHVLDEDGNLEHFDYLCQEKEDPRLEVAAELVEVVEDTGSVVVYNASFEKRCLRTLRDAALLFSDKVESIIDRLWDQSDIFSDWHYIHSKQKGSTSLKVVLPVLTEASYEGLGFQHGIEASIAYKELTDVSTPQSRKRELREKLFRYCNNDTRAMVKIHRALDGLSR